MERPILFAAVLSVASLLSAQSYDHNYVKVTTSTSLSGGSRATVIYYDGLGREEQTVMVCGSPAGGSIVSAREYDEYGREARSLLQGAVSGNTTGNYVGLGTLENCVSSCNDNDAMPYSLTHYEASPLNRPVMRYGPGAAWHAGGSHSVRMEYLLNISGDAVLNCKRYTAGITASAGGITASITNSGDWGSGALAVSKVTDEEGLSTYVFYDRNGETVLSRQVAAAGGSSVNYDTYYIRDEWGNLQAVLPPMASEQLQDTGTYADTHTAIAGYAYLYCYDKRYRQVGRKLPGCAWVYTVYDRSDAPILTQDGNQRARHEWSAVVPDAWGRPCVSGTVTSTAYSPAGSIGSCVKASRLGGAAYYTFSDMPFSFQKVMTETYYDDYTFIDSIAFPSFLAYSADYEYGISETARPVGLQTGVRSLLLDDTDSSYIYKATYYDYHKKPIQVRSTNHLGGAETEWALYDLLGRMTKNKHTHEVPNRAAHTQYEVYTYDAWDRLLTHTHSDNGSAPVTLASYTYDALGRVAAKTTGGLETTTYTYNVRSWPVNISGQRFTERLCYNGPVEGLDTTRPHQYRWNGTVAAYAWKTAGETRQRGYSLIYDGLDRLTAAHYGEGSGLDVFYSIYDERAAYDGMGNPVWIYRKGPVSVSASAKPSSPSDRLRLEYDGNQLVHVTDSVTSGHNYEGAFHLADGADEAVEYEYDANGNMTKDLNRNISSIQYNLLNLPSMIQFGDNSYIYNTYSAAGEKLTTQYAIQALPILSPLSGNGGTMETHPAAGTEDVTGGLRSGPATPIDTDHRYYCGNVVYDRGERRLLTDEGYVTFAADGTPHYHFYLRDHLGNIRVVFDQAGTVEQVTHYYPFGGLMRESTNPGLQPYKYGGKELDRTSGLDAYDFGARSYFADRMQWGQMDPLCEKYYDVSPYAYCGGNPIKFSDNSGCFRTDFIDGPQGTTHQYVNDGINQVLELSQDLFQRLDAAGFDPNSSVYKEALAGGLLRRDLFYTVENVLDKSSFVPFNYENCFKLAVKQNKETGTLIQGPNNRIDLLDEYACAIDENLIDGVKYLKEQLSSGKPLVVGVSTGVKHGNNNPNTGHFLNIVGMGFDSNGNYFSYYDNATSDIPKGTNLKENRFYFGFKNGTEHVLLDTSNVIVRNVTEYIISEIRRNQ